MSEPQTPVRTEIERSASSKLIETLGRYQKTIKALLPRAVDPLRFSYLVITAIRENPKMAEVSPASFLSSVILAMQMGIEIRRDSAYLIPFGNVCQLLIDYKAKIAMARRGGKVGGIQAVTVREHDEFEWKYGIKGVEFSHRPAQAGSLISSEDERGRIVGVYAFAQLTDGGMQFREPMSLTEIDRIRKRSRAGANFMTIDEIFDAHKLTEDGKQMIWQTWGYRDPKRQPWVTDFEQMALKTALHSLYKGIPLTEEAYMSQRVDEGFETGKQPDPLGEMIDIDPVDTQPMVAPPLEKEEFERAKEGKVAAARAENKKRDSTKMYPDFPDAMEMPIGTVIRVDGKEGYWQANEDRTAWIPKTDQ